MARGDRRKGRGAPRIASLLLAADLLTPAPERRSPSKISEGEVCAWYGR